jgi:hypothetical protein
MLPNPLNYTLWDARLRDKHQSLGQQPSKAVAMVMVTEFKSHESDKNHAD